MNQAGIKYLTQMLKLLFLPLSKQCLICKKESSSFNIRKKIFNRFNKNLSPRNSSILIVSSIAAYSPFPVRFFKFSRNIFDFNSNFKS